MWFTTGYSQNPSNIIYLKVASIYAKIDENFANYYLKTKVSKRICFMVTINQKLVKVENATINQKLVKVVNATINQKLVKSGKCYNKPKVS